MIYQSERQFDIPSIDLLTLLFGTVTDTDAFIYSPQLTLWL